MLIASVLSVRVGPACRVGFRELSRPCVIPHFSKPDSTPKMTRPQSSQLHSGASFARKSSSARRTYRIAPTAFCFFNCPLDSVGAGLSNDGFKKSPTMILNCCPAFLVVRQTGPPPSTCKTDAFIGFRAEVFRFGKFLIQKPGHLVSRFVACTFPCRLEFCIGMASVAVQRRRSWL